MKRKIVVLLGGISGERKISFLSGKACLRALKKKGYKVSVLDVNCPECANNLVEKQRKGRANKTFYGCSGYPECTFATNRKPISEPCPECSGLLVMWGQNRARCVKCPYKGTVKQNETTNEQLEVVV